MSFRKMNLGRSEILGRPSSPLPSIGRVDVENWRRRLGYVSMFAGVGAVLSAHATDVAAKETDKPVPPRIARIGQELLKKLNSPACTRPDLLKRQSEYRLPGQKGEFNMVELLAGTDTCPGLAIPPGNYTTGAPYTDSGNTLGANNTVTGIQAGCSEYTQVAGPDLIYSFKISARGANPQIRATTTSGTYDMAIYVLNGTTGALCPAGTANAVTNCLAGSDGTFAGSPETIAAAAVNALPLNTQLHLFVDSFYSSGGASAGPYTLTIQDVTVPSDVVPPSNDAVLDMNADGKTDYVLLRNIGGGASGQVRWFTAYRDGDPTLSTDWGVASDQFFSDDYDGDGRDDFGVFRPSTGTFYIVRSVTQTLVIEAFGQNGDDATVVGDYTGDGNADLAVYRAGATPADQSFWYYRPIGGGGFTTIPWGQGGDTPAPGDYDGDGKMDFVVQRDDPNGVNGRFWKRMNTGAQSIEIFGLKTDTVVPGDYDDDGKTDLAVVRDAGGFLQWDFEPSGTAGTTVVSDTWGVTATDWIAQGDYDGDGRTDYAVWREATPGRFHIMTVGTRVITISGPWGQIGDVPAGNFNSR